MDIREKLGTVFRRKRAAGDQRKTAALSQTLIGRGFRNEPLPKPTPANLRRFAETPVARKAINTIKDRIAGMHWRVQPRRGRNLDELPQGVERVRIMTETLEQPNSDDSFRSMAEQVLEDIIVGGFGALELRLTQDTGHPLELWPVDGATIKLRPEWDGKPESPRYVQVTGRFGPEGQVVLADEELSYIRLNPRTHTPFGLEHIHEHGTLSTRVHATEPFRLRPMFFSSAHPQGNGAGGNTLAADIRVVLECREIDPANPGSLAQPAIVLFDDIVTNAPATAIYVPLASESLAGSLNFVRIRRMPDVVVRTALPNQPYRTRLVGALSEGAECTIGSTGSLYFYSMLPPYPNEAIEVSYRTSARSAGHAIDENSMAEMERLMDDGVRGTVAVLEAPGARCSEDCALAAQTWLEDAARAGWSGEYACWSDGLPNDTADIFPGDAIHVQAASRGADFTAIVREVRIEAVDPQNGRERFLIRFADDAAQPIALQLGSEQSGYDWPNIVVDAGEPVALPAVNNAAITALTSTTMTIDAGVGVPPGGGFEVRRSDAAWGAGNDRNLAGRFTTRVFTLPRLARNQQYCIRQYDGSMPPRYSRHTTILYVDKPL